MIWNKGFRLPTQLSAIKCPDQCLPMVQYATGINSCVVKFTFQAVHMISSLELKKTNETEMLLNIIDNHLWPQIFSEMQRDNNHTLNSTTQQATPEQVCCQLNEVTFHPVTENMSIC